MLKNADFCRSLILSRLRMKKTFHRKVATPQRGQPEPKELNCGFRMTRIFLQSRKSRTSWTGVTMATP